MKLKILSWNIWCDGHMDAITQFLDAADADIIGLQEVMAHDASRDVVSHLTARGYAHVYGDSMQVGDRGMMGNAVFSKLPIVGSRVHELSSEDRRVAVETDIDVDGTMLHFFSTHLKHAHCKPSALQDEQARTLRALVPDTHAIVVGDFNATPDSETVRIMSEGLNNADPTSRPTWSMYPEGCPVCLPPSLDICFDYIFTTPDLATHGFVVGASTGSDHLPLTATVEVRD